MKKLVLFICIAVVVFSCSKEKPITISGKISNSSAENIFVKIYYLESIDTIAVAEDGTFAAEIPISDEYLAYIGSNEFRTSLYLKPGGTINIELDVEQYKKRDLSHIKITGIGSEESALLLNLQTKGSKPGMMELLKMPVDEFKTTMEETEKAVNDEIATFKTANAPSAKFLEIVNTEQQIGFTQKYTYFYRLHKRYAPEDDAEIPESFKEYGDAIPVDNFELSKELPSYKNHIVGHYSTLITDELQADTTLKPRTVAYTEKNIELAIAQDAPRDIKDEIGNRLIGSYSYSPDSIQKVYKANYKELVKNPKYIEAFEEILATIEKTKPGSTAPEFSYPDINGKEVSLASLRGKVVYVDVWATWCGPCKAEIPHLQKMEKALHNEEVAFVSISVDTDKPAWEKMVKEKELGGIQLHAEKAWECTTVKDFGIRGIPRFIIIDKEGKIVEASASRPSAPITQEKLLALAVK